MSPPIVTIKQGQLRGKVLHDYKGKPFHAFLGIPYGKPPVGDLRFKAPQPAESWHGIKDATKDGEECPAYHLIFLFRIGSEDNCLNLNIFTKNLPNDGEIQHKPVMVWIHGGAFLGGSNKICNHGPEYLMTEDIVLVTINYRLGVLGFLSLEDTNLEVPGNAGLKDIVLALKWVQENIYYFGGDSNNVTVFGESAGSAAVSYLLVSPLAAGLFHKAIMQSGVFYNGWTQGCRNALMYAKKLGYRERDERTILEKLRKESPRRLLGAQNKIQELFDVSIRSYTGPVVENPNETAFLSEDPKEILKSGRHNKVPIIIGYNSHEGLLWALLRRVHYYKLTTDFELEVPCELNLDKGTTQSRDVAERIKKHFYGEEEPLEDNIESTYMMKGDIFFNSGIHRAIHHLSQDLTHPIYVYKFQLNSSLNFYKQFCFVKSIILLGVIYSFMSIFYDKTSVKSFLHQLANLIPVKEFQGAGHADDTGYLFKNFASPNIVKGSLENTYISRLVKMWTNFARHGNPSINSENEDGLKTCSWKPWTEQQKYYLEMNTDLQIKCNPDNENVEFWKDIYRLYGDY